MQLYHLTPQQQQVCSERLTQVGQVLLNIDFSNPEQDQKAIRYHAYQKGKFDMLKELLEDNFPETDYTEE